MSKKIISMLTILMMILSSFSFAEVNNSANADKLSISQFRNYIQNDTTNKMASEAYNYFEDILTEKELGILLLKEEKATFANSNEHETIKII